MDQLVRLQASDLLYLLPELTLVISAIILSLVDLFMKREVSRQVLGWLALLGIAVSAMFVLQQMNPAQPIQLLNQSYRIDDYANLFKLIFLTGAFFVIFSSIGWVKKEDIHHEGEYYYLILPATLGGMVMASSGDLITLFVGLELLSITSYILVGLRKNNDQSNEGAFKYVVQGGIASAFILYGMSFLYGLSGSTNLEQIHLALYRAEMDNHALIYVSFFLLIVGFGFKIAAAPFHQWAPDVYQGAPTPITSFLAVVSKAAGFAIFFRIVYNVYFGVGSQDRPIHDDIFLTISVLAAAAMIIGNVMALKQKNLKRLLAYSGVANAGYLLVPIATQFGFVHYSNFTEFIFYLIAYVFMNLGIFAVLLVVTRAVNHDELSGFAGLYYRAPYTAVATIILVLSLAGIPVTGGFFGKLYILLGTLQTQHYWLAAILMATSVMSFFYYFGIIRQMFMRSSNAAYPVKVQWNVGVTIWVCAVVTVLLGIFPHVVVGYIQSIFSLMGDFFITSQM
jgi:NADH-quinone oxidoreductase subunit N